MLQRIDVVDALQTLRGQAAVDVALPSWTRHDAPHAKAWCVAIVLRTALVIELFVTGARGPKKPTATKLRRKPLHSFSAADAAAPSSEKQDIHRHTLSTASGAPELSVLVAPKVH